MILRGVAARCLSLTAILAGTWGCASEPPKPGDDFRAVEVSTVGMDLRSGSPVVLLRQVESDQIVPIWVGLAEAQAIIRTLHGIQMPRPMTHDLMGSLLSQLDVKVVEVVVHDMREGTYYGSVKLQRAGEDKIIEVDCRPSDGIALALLTRSPVRVAPKLLLDVPGFEFAPPDEDQQVVRWLGVTVVALSPELRKEFNIPNRPGVVAREVSPPASQHGVKRGDLIFEVNDAPVATPLEFFEAVRETDEGEPVRLRILRGDKEQVIEIPLDATEPPRRLWPGQRRDLPV
jgi:uncharacterized protein